MASISSELVGKLLDKVPRPVQSTAASCPPLSMAEPSAIRLAFSLISSPVVRGRERDALDRLLAGESVSSILAVSTAPGAAPAASGAHAGRGDVVTLSTVRRARERAPW